jgi:large subunit ribosomal protein L21
MYAIVRIGGRQYHAEIGNTIVVENLPYEVGQQMDFNEVLLLSDGENTLVGQPFVEGASLGAEVVEQFKGKKIIVFKYKPKIHYRRKQGHRQNYTRLFVHRIGDEGSQPVQKKARAAKKAVVSEEMVIAADISEPVEKKPRAKKSAAAKSGEEGGKPAAKKTRSAKKAETGDEA